MVAANQSSLQAHRPLTFPISPVMKGGGGGGERISEEEKIQEPSNH